MPNIQIVTNYPMLANADKATPERIGKVLDSLRQGNSLKVSAALAGIDRGTVARWAEADEAFAADLAQAQADFAESMVGHVKAAAPEDWKAASWLLSKSPFTREDYGETKGSGGTQVNIVLGIDREQGVTIEGEKIEQVQG